MPEKKLCKAQIIRLDSVVSKYTASGKIPLPAEQIKSLHKSAQTEYAIENSQSCDGGEVIYSDSTTF